MTVSARDEAVDISPGAHPQAWRQRGNCIRFFPSPALEARRRGPQSTTLHMGGK